MGDIGWLDTYKHSNCTLMWKKTTKFWMESPCGSVHLKNTTDPATGTNSLKMFILATDTKRLLVNMEKMFSYLYVLLSSQVALFDRTFVAPTLSFVPHNFISFTVFLFGVQYLDGAYQPKCWRGISACSYHFVVVVKLMKPLYYLYLLSSKSNAKNLRKASSSRKIKATAVLFPVQLFSTWRWASWKTCTSFFVSFITTL